ncbi:hypothetical protein [Enterococcus olivae]
MERLRSQYRYYSTHKKDSCADSQTFRRDFPEMAEWMRQRQSPNEKNQTHTLTHWLLLLVFGLLTVASFSQQLFLLLAFTLIAALVKGPGMNLFGLCYSFLVGLFPPLGILLSALFFLLSLYQLTRNWRFGLAGVFFYLYPLSLKLLQFSPFDQRWVLLLAMFVGLILLHLLFLNIYQEQPSSKALAWSLISLPYDCLLLLIPTKRIGKKRFRKRK